MTETRDFTWENEGDRWELFGSEGELVAAVVLVAGETRYCVEDPAGKRSDISFTDRYAAMALAERMLGNGD